MQMNCNKMQETVGSIHCSFIHALLSLIHSHIQGSHLSSDTKPPLPFNRFSFFYLLWCSRSSDIRRRVQPPPHTHFHTHTHKLTLPISNASPARTTAHTREHAHTPQPRDTPAGGTRTGTRVVMLHWRCGLKEKEVRENEKKSKERKERKGKISGSISITRW